MPLNTNYTKSNNIDCCYCDYIIKYIYIFNVNLCGRCLWLVKTIIPLIWSNLHFRNPYIIVHYFMLLRRSAKDMTSTPCITTEHCKTWTRKNVRAGVWREVLWNPDTTIAHITWQKLSLPVQDLHKIEVNNHWE